jgi:trimethylamine monooxygenase
MFELTSDALESGATHTETFDNVVVASGHFSVPNVPRFEGVEVFNGRVMHAHDFRDAAQFKGQDVLIVGASYSAEDIGLQCHKYGAQSVTMCYRTAAMGFDWPEGMDERPLLQRLEGRTAYFKDGSSKDFDALILATGYLHHFPFLEETLRLRARNRLYPPGLYKGVVFERNPGLMYIGMQDQYYTFTMFDAQAWYVRDILMGRISLPDAATVSRDSAAWVKREEALQNPEQDIAFQADYMRGLLREVDYPKFDIDLTVREFNEWEHHKVEDILGYRNKAFRSPCTGTMSPLYHTPWIQAMDDSIQSYVGGTG